jgi:hypothetical protein
MMKGKILSAVSLIVLLTVTGCYRQTYKTVYPTLNDGRYDTEFPYKSCAEELQRISESVFKIYCLIDYKTFLLNPESKLLPENVTIDELFEQTTRTTKTSEAASGSATLIYYQNDRIALLTCAHILSFPDTIYSYYNDNDPYTPDYLQGISIKTKTRIFFRGYPEGNELEIIAMDKARDLVILGKYTGGNTSALRTFMYPLGHSEKLEWGSFVYIMGFPLGYQMVTRGIVSKPVPFTEDSFLIDAVFNEGFSGSIVLAIMDGVPNFQLVGLGKSAAATFDNILVPSSPEHEMIYNPNVPYTGEIFVNMKKDVNYGITYAISTQPIREFFKENRDSLEEKGYYLDSFFLEKK